jgi:pyridoxal phosphate enzyme (YggS family)
MSDGGTQGVEARVDVIEARIVAACERAGRLRDSVQLVCVSKKRTPEEICAAHSAGIQLFGENRVQEGMAKIPLCPSGVIWHLIGHLQTNKVRPCIELFEMIHSVDTLRLLEMIDRMAVEAGRVVDVCLQVNVSGEGSKYGFEPDAVADVLGAAEHFFGVNVVGLMTMAPFSADPEDARPHFRALRELRDTLRARTGVPLDELSMGMSGDFEVAIEEGATLIRVGTAIFEDGA